MFDLGTAGLVMDQFGKVLLIQRDDTLTWSIPGGALAKNELPSDGMVREVFEETGYKVHPVRLAQVSYRRESDIHRLIFVIRGIMRGGTAKTSAETLAVAFVDLDTKPTMLGFHRQQIATAMYHPGGAPYLVIMKPFGVFLRLLRWIRYRYMDWQRQRRNEPVYTRPQPWHLSTTLIIRNQAGELLWQKDGQLPGGACSGNLAPWEEARQWAQQQTGATLTIRDLAGVYVGPENRAWLCFVAEVEGNAAASPSQWHAWDTMKEQASPLTQQMVTDALAPRETTVFAAASLT